MDERQAVSNNWMLPAENAKPTLSRQIACAGEACTVSRAVDVRAIPEGTPLCVACFQRAAWEKAKLATSSRFRLGA